ncbi:MAG: hypothetical protein A3B99_00315 [Candidatus Yanofskybacteria bacterium RIFCSPHIGHO2_02_FULL_44_12b]|uniref:PEGA domain-containing protein n=2 Tax=Candidatus Yanofskyibacteriota TaxID=1752733 RepID=A0A1F8GKQ9_9BACT|nr:MAG: hypothetical protein UW79_C0006G0029 [Candidatus Yanofskybacteria bacterium GW2011_GWA2_44_9]OGN04195.1 MAG: hypothetical protein A2659_01760 [Candidatus Yanofskybacteria bacterium RIFCSPHIGHO2_01_FULL_44_24]OGN14789.1 MAG: hypothetical protein A3B99_00315 [Candidatus Yanofskybacteria bacterium RIFCSPHIGHO2_02_FULL_44_12b]OGN25921.1 MAG: hypothetical protein A2925_02680 [Candidatus Yanofskybacteria bacterium RIFCSPLOWO2_01_FULL_44_22]
MTERDKRILFYTAVAVFFLLAYFVVLYAQGYKYSFSDNRFVRTGTISLRANTNASVYLDGEFKGDTSFFNNSFGIERLLPGEYEIRVEKENYSTWHKKVAVEEGFVTDFSKILILPLSGADREEIVQRASRAFALSPTPSPHSTSSGQATLKPKPTPKPLKPSPTLTPVYTEPFVLIDKKFFKNNDQQLEKLGENVIGFALSKYKNKLLWWTLANEIWVMWIGDTNYQPHRKNNERDIVTKLSAPIKNAIWWFDDEDHIVIDANGYKIIEIDTRDFVNIIEI